MSRRPLRSQSVFENGLRVIIALVSIAAASLLATGCSRFALSSSSAYRAAIARTPGGIPHIRADDAGSLGFGTLYAMAEDNVCILADQYLTFAAGRSRALGPTDDNLESDLFHQLLIDRGQGAEDLPSEVDALFQGAADGYNHYLRVTGVDALPDPACRGASWVSEVSALDVRRVSRADYALAYMRPLLVKAAPPVASRAPAHEGSGPRRDRGPRLDERYVAQAIARVVEAPKQGGSNAIAIGREASPNGGGLLLANPHMPWNEPFQRFYPMHQTLTGRFDVMGATLIGRPRVGFGHNADVAWTSTVSTAKRMTFYRLELAPGDPTRYVFDGEARPMLRERVTVAVRTREGRIEARSHTFYSTHFGAHLIESEHFPWSERYAFAVRLIDPGWRGEISGFEQLAARSVRELESIHDRYQFLTVNLIAADRDGEVLYGDLGPVPHLTDAQSEDCAVLQGAALDGSRSACMWGRDPQAAARGIFGPARSPRVIREDFVLNSNDSHWLPNPAAPLAGFPRIYGSEATPRTLRTRSALRMLGAVRRADSGDVEGLTLDTLQTLALSNESEAAVLLRDDVVAACRAQPVVDDEESGPISLVAACDVLAAWDGRADLDSRGSHLFRELLSEANEDRFTRQMPARFTPAIPFDPADPIGTPSGLAPASREEALAALAGAVRRLTQAGIPLDAELGRIQGVTRAGEWIPLHGGTEQEGIFNKLEAAFQGSRGYPDVSRWSSTWIQAVELGREGPRSRGILTYSLSANPQSPHHVDQTKLFSRKEWLDLPYRAEEVEAAALRRYVVEGFQSTSE